MWGNWQTASAVGKFMANGLVWSFTREIAAIVAFVNCDFGQSIAQRNWQVYENNSKCFMLLFLFSGNWPT